MKIDELINVLQKIRDTKGNLDVEIISVADKCLDVDDIGSVEYTNGTIMLFNTEAAVLKENTLATKL